MAVSDLNLINLNLAIYNSPLVLPVGWDHYNDGTDKAGICWGIKQLSDIDCLVFRGSTSFEDWIRDFAHFAIAENEPPIGEVHPGFYAGMPEAFAQISPLLGERVVVTGHSLGAARADVFCALMLASGKRPLSRVVFGEPKPGLSSFVTTTEGRSYINSGPTGHDLVTDVPLTFPPEDYDRPIPLSSVSAPPTLLDRWGPFCWHHAELYAEGIGKLNPIPLTL